MAVPTIAVPSKISLNFEPAKNGQFGPKSKICFSQFKELGPKILYDAASKPPPRCGLECGPAVLVTALPKSPWQLSLIHI